MATLVKGGSGNIRNQSKLINIQYLRGIAAIFVVLYHMTNLIKEDFNYAYLNNVFRFGYMGVDLFFVLSGFIITYIHYKDFAVRAKWKTYFVRRYTRIFPVYWIVLFPVIILHLLIPSFGIGPEGVVSEILKSMFLIPQDHHPILDVAWTLKHEMFFYIMFGFLFIFNRNRTIFITFLVVWTAMSTYSLLLKPKEYWLLYDFLFSPHNLQFLFGCMTAFVLSKYDIDLKAAWICIVIGSCVFLLSCINEFTAFVEVSRVFKWGIPSALLILGMAALDTKTRTNKILAYVGDASYSIYLTHVPAIYLCLMIFKKFSPSDVIGYFPAVTLCVVLTLAGGCLFYRMIEQPILKLLKRYPSKKQPSKTTEPTTPHMINHT